MVPTRQFFYHLSKDGEEGLAQKPTSILARWIQLKPFLRFIATRPRPILAYDLVTPPIISAYVKAQKRATISGSTLYNRFRSLAMLFQYRRKMSTSLTFDPFFPRSAALEAGYGASYKNEHRTDYIPDKPLQKLITCALEYIEDWGPKILELSDIAERMRSEAPETAISRLDINKASLVRFHIRRRLKELDASFTSPKTLPIRPRLRNLNELQIARTRLRAACGIMILFVSGIRLSELLSLRAGCIEVEEKKEGTLIWLHGTLYKMQSDPADVPAKWLGGPIAEKAIAILERLTKKTREMSGVSYLMVPVTPRARQLWTKSGSLSEAFDSRSLSDFVNFIQLKTEKGAPYHLHPHLFRRTFARHVVRCDTTNLMALKEHFKHYSLAMTDGYVGIDEELQQILDLENNLLAFDSFDKALRSTHLSGRRGKQLVGMVDKAITDGVLPPDFRGEAGSHFRKKMIREFIEAGQQIYPCGASNFCWFRQDSADCTNGDKPVVEFCNPPGCANAIIDPEEHGAYWQNILTEAESLLAMKPKGGPYEARLVKITRIARKIVSGIAD